MLLLLACTSTDSATDSGDDSGTDTTTVPLPGTVTLGATCSVETRTGEVALWANGDRAYLSATLYDRPNPWFGPPTLQNATCAYHHVDTSACGTCDAGLVCGWSGACVPEARAVTDASLTVTVDNASQTFAADPTTGQMWGDAGPLDGEYALAFTFAGQSIEVPPLRLATAPPDLLVTGVGSADAPVSIDATWTAAPSGRVRTVIPINHHAGGPTFTRCDVEAATPGFHANEDMLVPLAVSTGLEFQGVEVTQSAAAYTALGCVDVRLGVQTYIGVTWG